MVPELVATLRIQPSLLCLLGVFIDVTFPCPRPLNRPAESRPTTMHDYGTTWLSWHNWHIFESFPTIPYKLPVTMGPTRLPRSHSLYRLMANLAEWMERENEWRIQWWQCYATSEALHSALARLMLILGLTIKWSRNTNGSESSVLQLPRLLADMRERGGSRQTCCSLGAEPGARRIWRSVGVYKKANNRANSASPHISPPSLLLLLIITTVIT